MSERQRLAVALGIVGVVVVLGTIGYVLIEGLSPIDALYETAITISTVGYSEPAGGLSDAGRFFTVVLIFVGVGSVFYSAAVALEVFVDELVGGRRRRRREERMIGKLEGHTIVCGYGRVGRSVASRLAAKGIDLVIVDIAEDRIERAHDHGFAAVLGNATFEDVLTAAGLERAASLVACVHSDAENLSIVLSARVRRTDLYILARASDVDAERRIRMAGADRVITPPEVGAERLAALVLHPQLTEFVDIAAAGSLFEFRVVEFNLSPDSELVGQTLAESRIRSRVGTSVLAVRHENGTIATNPDPMMPLEANDVLVAIGTAEQLEQLGKLV